MLVSVIIYATFWRFLPPLDLWEFILGHPLLVLMLTGSACHVCVGRGLMGYILLLPHHVVGNFTSIETWGSVKVGASEFKVCGCWTCAPESSVRGQFYVFTPVHIIYSSWELKPRRLISWHLLNNAGTWCTFPLLLLHFLLLEDKNQWNSLLNKTNTCSSRLTSGPSPYCGHQFKAVMS